MIKLPLLDDKSRLDSILKAIPAESGVYFMRDELDSIIYIGKSKKLRSRIRSYFRDTQSLSTRIACMVQKVTNIEFIVTDTEAEALTLEANLIKKHQPYFNVLLKDDKKYPYVCITWSEEYPRIFITRKRTKGHKKDRYYGPYVDSGNLRETLALLKEIFPLRQRPKPLFKHRPCLNYDLGRCPGVCQELISPEEYRKTVDKVAMVFAGRVEELESQLQSQMTAAAAEMEFETAAKIRDRLFALNSLKQGQKVESTDERISMDAIALVRNEFHCCIQLFQIRGGLMVGRLGFFTDTKEASKGEILQTVLEEHYRQVDSVEIPNEILIEEALPEGELLTDWLTNCKGRKVNLIVPMRGSKVELIEMVKRNAQYELDKTQRESDANEKAMEDLALVLDLPSKPSRIEGYDISHIQGSNAVASRVVFIDGIPAKQHYRHYKIKNPEIKIGHSDDFASMKEVISRRFAKNLEAGSVKDLPDLVLIDGGKGQLSAVVEVLEEMNLLGMFPVIGLAKKEEEIFLPFMSDALVTEKEQPGVQLLRRVRDEAHRFGVGFHRQQRLKQSRRSILDEIPGIGLEKQKKLLEYFHSVDYIRAASIEDLLQVSGIGQNLAQEIYQYFHLKQER